MRRDSDAMYSVLHNIGDATVVAAQQGLSGGHRFRVNSRERFVPSCKCENVAPDHFLKHLAVRQKSESARLGRSDHGAGYGPQWPRAPRHHQQCGEPHWDTAPATRAKASTSSGKTFTRVERSAAEDHDAFLPASRGRGAP